MGSALYLRAWKEAPSGFRYAPRTSASCSRKIQDRPYGVRAEVDNRLKMMRFRNVTEKRCIDTRKVTADEASGHRF
jgi:hypothetical protein